MDGHFDSPPSGAKTDRQVEIDRLAAVAGQLGRNIVDVSGMLDGVAAESKQQAARIGRARAGAAQIEEANVAVLGAARAVSETTSQSLAAVEASVERVRSASHRTRDVAGWVGDLKDRMDAIETSLNSINKSNIEITSIASQVSILAINAKIEAARAGEAGRGFAFLADAVNELSRKTAATAETIRASIRTLTSGIGALKDEANDISAVASDVLAEGETTDAALSDIPLRIRTAAEAAQAISARAEEVEAATRNFGPVFEELTSGFRQTAEHLQLAKERANGLIDASEEIVQGTVAIGANTEDQRFIARVKEIAAEIGTVFEAGVARHAISERELFTRQYQPIAGSDPEQVMAPFTLFTDQVLPPIQEAAFDLSDKVVFCATVDDNGYLPTHNLKFSKPQGSDPVWNAANCRNRRLFNDRVGLKAGRSKAPFLLQVYRRDMGGGQFAMMKDLSAPILVNGRHWGGVRLAYRF